MARDTTLADRLRHEGLKVREVSGWKTRGSDVFHPKAFVRHHTAGPASGLTPCLAICVKGRSDLPGPLCNIYLGRDGVVYVVAAGRANHAGLPDGDDWKGCKGNSDAYGIEIEHTGTTRLSPELHALAARACAAIIRGRFGTSMVCDHKEWAPSRKIDLATGPSPAEYRQAVSAVLDAPPVARMRFLLLDGQGKELARSVTVQAGPDELKRLDAFLDNTNGAMLKELRRDGEARVRRVKA